MTAGPRLTRRAVSRLLPSLPLALSACAGSPAARGPGAPYHHTADGFRNPPGSPTRGGAFEDWLGFFWRNMNRDGAVPLPDGHVVPQPEALARLAGETGDSLTWLGHASFLIRLGGRTILTDPFLTPHASPLPPLGPERFAPPGLAPGALPPVDVLLIRFHIKTERTSFAATVDFLRDSIAAAERLYVQAPALKINPTFVQAAHRRIETRRDADGKPFTYIGFENSQDLVRFMDENFDHYARTRTDGHMTVLVVDQAVQNEDKGKGLCGRAAFPHAVSLFSRKVGMLLVPCDVNRDGQLDVFILAHELGHYFSLLHTFGRYVDITPQSPGNCNKAFGNHARCNSCQGTIQTKNGEPRLCDGTSNVMDYCTSATGVEILNACQLNRASDQMKRYQTRDGQTDYVALAGVRGTPACAADTDCASGEYCNAGFPGVARARCVSLNQHGALCTNDRQCATGRCAWGRCADADECRADGDCGSAQYCGDPVSGKRTCKALHADNEACALAGGDKQCASGHCQSGRCFTPQSVALNGTCYVNDACSQGKCSSVNGTRGTCVCDRDGDCGSGYWCNAGLDVNLNRCERKLDKGEVCGKIGELGVGHRCKSGSCKASFGVNLKCT